MNEENWIPQEITKTFDEGNHLIWIISENKDIIVPEGYHHIKTDQIIIKGKIFIRTFLVNDVPVEAELYKNIKTKEISYFFPGTPISKEKAIVKTK